MYCEKSENHFANIRSRPGAAAARVPRRLCGRGYLAWFFLITALDFPIIALVRWRRMENPPELLETELKRQNEEMQFRAAIHWYFYRNVGVATLHFKERYIETGDPEPELGFGSDPGSEAVSGI